MYKLLVVGKIPPPIGGASIHVERMIHHLERDDFDFIFYDLYDFNFFSLVRLIKKTDIVHCHSNNRIFLFITVLVAIVFRKKSVLTIHGNVGSRGIVMSFFEKQAIKFVGCPIVLNQESFNKVSALNKNLKKLSSFIFPIKSTPLVADLKLKLKDFITEGMVNCCINASGLFFDKNEQEIYGVLTLLEYFKHDTTKNLIISDPSGMYAKHIEKENLKTDNVFIIDHPHDFYEILKISDCFIRPTTTDGDSLSIKEAITLNKIVIASDCVERPKGVLLYNAKDELFDLLSNPKKWSTNYDKIENGYDLIIAEYNMLMKGGNVD